MINAKCIHKFRDNHDRITGYRLVDINGQTNDISSEDLKKAILNRQINVLNLTLTKDKRLVDTAISDNKVTLTKKLYLIICNNKAFKALSDYKIKCRYDDASNRLCISSKFIPSFGLDLEQLFFNGEENEQHIIVTDRDKEFYMYVNNELALRTKDCLLVLNMLNIVDRRFELIDTLRRSPDIIQASFSSFCGSAGYADFTKFFRDDGCIEYDSYTPIQLLKACIMEMKYEGIKKNKKNLINIYNGYIFRGQSSKEFNGTDASFKSATTSMNVALQYGKNGVILAIKGVRLCDIIDINEAACYDKDYVYYEHEVLIRDFNKIHIGNQIGTLKGIPIYTANLEVPQCNRIKLIKDRCIGKYGNKKQLYIIFYILKNMKLLDDIEITIHGINVYGCNESEVCIEFKNNDIIVMNDIKYDNIQDIIKDYSNMIGIKA